MVLNPHVVSLLVALKFGGISDHPRIHVLHTMDDFLMTAMNHRSLHWVTKVATSPLDNITGCRVSIPALWTLKTGGGSLKFALKAALEALIN